MNKNEGWEAVRDNKLFFEGERGQERKRRGKYVHSLENVWTSA
jgi:hypothetical protein